MSCPNCNSDEVDPAGACLICGLSVDEADEPNSIESTDKESRLPGGMIEVSYGVSERTGEEAVDQPEWRAELSRRLQEIKRRRESPVPNEPGPDESIMVAPEGTHAPPAAAGSGHTPATSKAPAQVRAPKPPGRRVAKSPSSAGKTRQTSSPTPPGRDASGSLPLFEMIENKPATPLDPSEIPLRHVSSDPGEAQAPVHASFDGVLSHASAPEADDDIPHRPPPPSFSMASHESGLLLLTRTLSGLVDILIVSLCAIGYMVAADLVAGVDLFDWITALVFSVVWLATYFLYSLFFMASANQTIGMMMTNLRIVDERGRRPRFGQLLSRSTAYLPSLLLLGAGLLWGFFDGRRRCLHDSISGTRIIRI